MLLYIKTKTAQLSGFFIKLCEIKSYKLNEAPKLKVA